MILWANGKAKEIFGRDIVGKSCCEALYGKKELCVDECEWCQATPDPYNTGDHGYVQSECTVPTPRQCPAFEDYVKEHS